MFNNYAAEASLGFQFVIALIFLLQNCSIYCSALACPTIDFALYVIDDYGLQFVILALKPFFNQNLITNGMPFL